MLQLAQYLDEPVEFMDDAMAALRYAVEDFRRARQPIRINPAILQPRGARGMTWGGIR